MLPEEVPIPAKLQSVLAGMITALQQVVEKESANSSTELLLLSIIPLLNSLKQEGSSLENISALAKMFRDVFLEKFLPKEEQQQFSLDTIGKLEVPDQESAKLLIKIFETLQTELMKLDDAELDKALLAAIAGPMGQWVLGDLARTVNTALKAPYAVTIGTIKSRVLGSLNLSPSTPIEGRNLASVLKYTLKTFLLEPLIEKVKEESSRLEVQRQEELKKREAADKKQKQQEELELKMAALQSIEEAFLEVQKQLNLCNEAIAKKPEATDELERLGSLIGKAKDLIEKQIIPEKKAAEKNVQQISALLQKIQSFSLGHVPFNESAALSLIKEVESIQGLDLPADFIQNLREAAVNKPLQIEPVQQPEKPQQPIEASPQVGWGSWSLGLLATGLDYLNPLSYFRSSTPTVEAPVSPAQPQVEVKLNEQARELLGQLESSLRKSLDGNQELVRKNLGLEKKLEDMSGQLAGLEGLEHLRQETKNLQLEGSGQAINKIQGMQQEKLSELQASIKDLGEKLNSHNQVMLFFCKLIGSAYYKKYEAAKEKIEALQKAHDAIQKEFTSTYGSGIDKDPKALEEKVIKSIEIQNKTEKLAREVEVESASLKL